jgi:hypothetical protein
MEQGKEAGEKRANQYDGERVHEDAMEDTVAQEGADKPAVFTKKPWQRFVCEGAAKTKQRSIAHLASAEQQIRDAKEGDEGTLKTKPLSHLLPI